MPTMWCRQQKAIGDEPLAGRHGWVRRDQQRNKLTALGHLHRLTLFDQRDVA